MTLLSLRNTLIAHFCQQDTFRARDIEHISVGKGLDTHKDALVRAALAELEAAGILRYIPGKAPKGSPDGTALPAPSASDLWILSSPLGSMGQDIHLSLHTAHAIADCINTFLDANDLPGERVDPLNLSEGHIVSILEILNDILTMDPPEDDPDAPSDTGGGGPGEFGEPDTGGRDV